MSASGPASGSNEVAADVAGSEAAANTQSATGGTGPGGSRAAAGGAGSKAPAGAAAASSKPCAAPSKEKGVTDKTITVGSISSLSGPVPGLGSSSAAAVRAEVARRNAEGGVCGRKLVLKEADDGTDSSQYRSTLRRLNPDVLGISGGLAIGDIGSEDLINELAIPIVNTPTGHSGTLKWVVDINPDYPKPDMVIGKYKWLYEQGSRKVSMTYLGADQTRIEANIQRKLIEAAGLQVVHTNELPLSTLSYDSAARAAANSGADYLWFVGDTNGAGNMAKSVHNTGHKWLFKEFSYTTYGTKFIDIAGPEAAEGASSWLRSLPTEEASTNAAMGGFVEWMKRVAPGLPQDLFAIDSYVGTKVFFEALDALPGPISRDALINQLLSIQTYDAGGMFAPISLGKDLSQGCFMGMIVHNGKWTRMAPPGKGYLC